MPAIRMDGLALAGKIKTEIAEKIKTQRFSVSLAVILVGDNPASQIYVRNKHRDCLECGITSFEFTLPGSTTQRELLDLIRELNARDDVDGILLQLPLPEHISEKEALRAVDPLKDVDAFHPYNVGLIVSGDYRFLPCTPAGVMALLDAYKIEVEGKHCVIIGRSNIVGKPQSLLLLARNGTVTVCHSKTPNLSDLTKQADILVSAVGKAGLITAEMIKEGAVIIDVAMNKKPDGKLCGDVRYDEVCQKAAYITPVPGGVGPMTRAMLMQNTLKAAEIRKKQNK